MSQRDAPILSYAPAPPRSRWQSIAVVIALGFLAIAASYGIAWLVDLVYPHRYGAHAFVQIGVPDGSPTTDALGRTIVDELQRTTARPPNVFVEHVPGTRLIHVAAKATSPQQAVANVTSFADRVLATRPASGATLSYAQRAVRPDRPSDGVNVRNVTFALCMLASCIIVPLVIRRRAHRLRGGL